MDKESERIVIIAGVRDWHKYADVHKAVAMSGWKIKEVVSGHADGVDRLGEMYADELGLDLTIMPVNPRQWKKYGPSAGPRRNKRMAYHLLERKAFHEEVGLIALWDGKSRGTKNMIETAKSLGIETFVYTIGRH